MPHCFTLPAPPVRVRLPYCQATAAQRALAVDYLQQRLAAHFPTLRVSSWPAALADHQPDLWLRGSAVALAETDLIQLAQHLAAAPELPVLDPPLYGLPALHLAQYTLQCSELAVWALAEVAAGATACGPRLYALLRRLAHPSPLAEQVVQAWCWNLASAPPLVPGIPGAPPRPDSAEIEHLLGRLKSPESSCAGNGAGTRLLPKNSFSWPAAWLDR
ncbi:hypothetical protein ACFST9_12615 [Hymenobacter monticola]|uniref:Uncharacterized protein n=1 Tax=Hymenobacter monticola TaxID=1705399 RepID=A0ABY4BBF7_9BACT|nr:hypothetical protein [Hymenobacter monticola]UOE36462.1 hypothetical protein MTP16_23530 [Hymenobacter monticola]